MFTTFDAVTGRLNADNLDAVVIQERMEHADGVGATTDAGHQRIRQAAFALLHLFANFVADHALENVRLLPDNVG